MEPKAEHKKQPIDECKVNNKHLIKGAKNILSYQKDSYLKLLEYEEDANKRCGIEERIKEIDFLISQIEGLYNYHKQD